MASITISQLDESTLERLRLRATDHGRTVEEEAGEILKGAVSVPPVAPDNLYDAIRRRVEPLGGFDLPEIARNEPGREPPTFD
jgi:plasmid stability protein